MRHFFKYTLTFLTLNLSLVIGYSQVAINENNNNPDASAMLDVSSTDKGILIPRMGSTARENINNPARGLMVFDSTTNSFWYYTTTWTEINSDNQTIDELSIDGNLLSLSLENDGEEPQTVNLSQLDDICLESGLNAGFTGFESGSRLSVDYKEQGGFPVETNNTDPSWQSFTATENGKVNFIQFTYGNNANSSYTFYEGEGTSGQQLGTSSATNPNALQWKSIDFSGDSIVLVKGRKYTVGFDSRFKMAYENNNLHPGGQAGDDSDRDYVMRVYIFPSEYALEVENGKLGELHIEGGSSEALKVSTTANDRYFSVHPAGGSIDIYNSFFNINRYSSQDINIANGGGDVGIGTNGDPQAKLEDGESDKL
ncbi:MAG: hypothetical protein AAF599_13360 [Bacteroidota bacterium]